MIVIFKWSPPIASICADAADIIYQKEGRLSINKQVIWYNRATYVSDLVCNTREGSSESGWAHLGELYGDHTPRTLNAKLHTENASRKRTEARRKNPERNENPADRDKKDNREPAAD